MIDSFSSPWPPALHFTPEVQSGIRAATEMEAGPGWDIDPAEFDPELLAEQILLGAPDLARFLLQLDMEAMEESQA